MTDKADTHREGTDEALVVKYQRGDRTALSVLVRRHARALYTTAYYVCNSEDIASELTLRVFQQVIEQAGSFHIEMHFRTWVFGFMHQQLAAQNECSEALPSFAPPGEIGAPEPSSTNALARLGRSQLVNRRVTACIAGLPRRVREAIVLKLVAQLTIPELASAMATKDDAVRELLRSALEQIRDAISDTEDYARALR
ncbi:MAG: sigma factor-like helix-turn-helix DNA-binding protein [Polyangiaceae bacterium]